MYCSEETNNNQCLFEQEPPQGNPRQGGWKTINGHDYQSRKLKTCLIINEQLWGKPYRWFVSLNFHDALTEAEISKLWKQASRKLKHHITALWVREPSRSNRCNYHLIIANPISEADLKQAIKQAIPPHINHKAAIRPMQSTYKAALYITKSAEHRGKRVYFADHITLNKHGSIGSFWKKSITAIWQSVIKHERNLAAIINTPEIRHEARKIYHLLDGYLTLKSVRRRLAECSLLG